MNKTQRAIELLSNGPMKYKEFLDFVGDGQGLGLCRRGIVEQYIDENPDYAAGRKYQRPMATFVRLGSSEYTRIPAKPKTSPVERIAKAVSFLEKHGYKIIAPSA